MMYLLQQEHVDTVVDCPFWYLAMQLAKLDDHKDDAAITHLSYLFHSKVPVNMPKEDCLYCQERHLGACPYHLVTLEMVQNIINPAVLYLHKLF